MRLPGLIFLGISLLGCKDRPGAPAASSSPPAPAAAASQKMADPPAPVPVQEAPVTAPATDRPTLPFDSEPEDKAWADATEKAIHAVAPELTDIVCRKTQCQATVTAASPEALATLTDKLQAPESLPSTEAKHVLLTAPKTAGGKTFMTIQIRYER